MLIEFSTTQVIMLFRDAGLEVKFQDIPVNLSNDPENPRIELIPALTVINPHTKKVEIAKDIFEKYVRLKINDILIPADKLEIYKLFNYED
jgi:hypothetical protein